MGPEAILATPPRPRVLGGFQSDFARNLRRDGLDLSDLCREAVLGTLGAAGVDPEQIDAVHVGNAFGQLYTGQGHLGALPATVVPELGSVPAMRHEAACASGSLAILTAMGEIEAGRYDCVLVLGMEQEKSLPSPQAAQVQAAAAYVGHEDEQTPYVWPQMFARIAEAIHRKHGLDDQHLRAIAKINRTNALSNANAQTRFWSLEPAAFTDDDTANPPLAGRLRKTDCCPLTDGAAGVVLVSERWLAEHGRHAHSAIAGWGHTTVGLPLDVKLDRALAPDSGPWLMPQVRRAVTDAWRRAGVESIRDIDVVETHDCLTPSEYLAIDHLGITAPGEAWKAVEDGRITRDGSIPVNPSGGLLGGGHPVGATGVRMLVDAHRQITNEAGAVQIVSPEGVQRVQTLNIGGSFATTVSFVVEAR